MAANVLNSRRAVQASIQVVRAFVRLREILASHKELASMLDALEKKYDRQLKLLPRLGCFAKGQEHTLVGPQGVDRLAELVEIAR